MKQIHFRYQYLFVIALMASGILYLFLQPMPVSEKQHTLCYFHQLTGMPCPACGTWRGMVCILHGEFLNAWMFNPLSFVVLIFSIVVAGWMFIDLGKNQFTFIPAMKKPVSPGYLIVPLILVLMNWYWNFVKGL